MLRTRLAVLPLAALVLAGCGSSSSGKTSAAAGGAPTSAAPTAAAPKASTIQLVDTSLGKVVADTGGMTLYLFQKDSGGTSACTGGCATLWPPYAASGPLTASGAEASDLATITRPDGTSQVTYYGHPLYRYAPDSAPGDVKGQGVGGVWFAVRVDGNPAQKQSDAPMAGY